MVNEDVVYICTRIFNYNDKLQAEYFEDALKRIANVDTFMPFRDTDENNLVGSDRTRIVYDADINRLNSGEIKLLGVLYDGICKDEGISFEIGYAYGKGIPVFIVNTDFIWYTIEKKEFLFDPVVEAMCLEYVHYYEIEKNQSFKMALSKGQQKAFELASSKIAKILQCTGNLQKQICCSGKKYDVFIDFGGGRYEYQREYASELKERLAEYSINVAVGDRYFVDDSLSNYQKGMRDIENLMCSNCYVCLGDELELNSGTAALLGLARCNKIETILYESSNIEIHGENGHRMKKNLIIDFSIDKIAKSKKEIIGMIVGGKGCLKI